MCQKYLSNFWGSLEMPLIDFIVELKSKLAKDCVLATDGADNADNNSNDIVSTIKERKLYISVATLSEKTTKNYQNFLAKDFKDKNCIEMNIKQTNTDIFLNQTL